MGLIQGQMEIPTEHMANVFGQFDAYLKKIENALKVTIVVREQGLKLTGEEQAVIAAKNIFTQLVELSRRGNQITEQNVNYVLELCSSELNTTLVDLDGDIICHTIQGKPVKPKTLGQKDYVDQIRKKMIVFGVGPAGTGKTYLAMAMAVTAFRNEEGIIAV